jgi:hypothetical protein
MKKEMTINMNKRVIVEMKVETKVELFNGELVIKPSSLQNTPVNVYICYDNVKCFVGEVENTTSLFDLIGPYNFMEVLDNMASEYEWDAIYTALEESEFSYWIGNKEYKI